MTYKTNKTWLQDGETWLQDSQNSNLWHAENGLMVNSAALKEREIFFSIERVYSGQRQESWTQDDLDCDLWHGPNGLIINTAALEERESYFEVTRVYAVEPYLNLRNYPCASC